MIRRLIIMLVAVAIVMGGYFAFQQFKAKMIHQFLATLSNPPQVVSTVVAADQQWQPQLQAVGSLRAVNGATLSLEVAGAVEKINFESGQDVQVGQPLLQLRAEDDIAKLESLQASAALAQVNYDRDLRQFRAQAVSQVRLRPAVFASYKAVSARAIRASGGLPGSCVAIPAEHVISPGVACQTLPKRSMRRSASSRYLIRCAMPISQGWIDRLNTWLPS